MPRLLDEGERLFLEWARFTLLTTILFTAVVGLLLWLGALLSAPRAEAREERSAPYDQSKVVSGSMLFEPEMPIVGWSIGPELDFIESGRASATPEQWAEALRKAGRIAQAQWQTARAYLTTLRWEKYTATEWYRMCRVLRPLDARQPTQLDCEGYERAIEPGAWGLHDPKTGELVVDGSSGNVVVRKLTTAATAVSPPPATPQPAGAPSKFYVIWVLRDPRDILLTSGGKESADVDERRARALLADAQSGVQRVKLATGAFTLTLYDQATPNPNGSGYNCNLGFQWGKPYEVAVKEGYGFVSLPLIQNRQARCIRAQMTPGLRRVLSLKSPRSGTLDFVPSQVNEPTNLWFIVW